MTFEADFTAIDFETASRRTDSACQLAAVVVRGGQVVREKMWMIRPDPFLFSPMNISIHGIRPEDVESEKSFGDHWPEIQQFVDGDCLIAHNAPFDIGVMLSCLARHQIDPPELHFSCTRLIAKQAWPDRQRYGLKPLSNWLGVQFRHHDALEDSIACARVLLAAGLAKEATSMEDLEGKLGINRGKAGAWGVSHASKKSSRKRKPAARKTKPGLPKRTLRKSSGRALPLPEGASPKSPSRRPASPALPTPPMNPFDEAAMTEAAPLESQRDPSAAQTADWQRVVIRAEFIQPLRGRCVVISGTLRAMNADQVAELTTRSGGVHQESIDERTNCVVLGASSQGEGQGELDQIQGKSGVEILSESEFLGMVGFR